MFKLSIKEPLWMGGGSVGISSKIKDDVIVEILHKDRMGNKVYPYLYKITWNNLMNVPIIKFKKGVPVRVVAIKDLEIVKL